MIVDSSDKITAWSKSSSPFAAGHCLISVHYQFSNLNRVPQTITYRNFTNCDYLSLENDLTVQLRLKFSHISALESSHRASDSDLSEQANSLSILYKCITEVLNTHAPFVTKRITHRSIPWLTPDLRSRIKERDKLFTRAKRSRNTFLLEQYRNLRRETKNVVKLKKNQYLANLVLQQTNPNKLWSCLRNLGLTNVISQSALHHFSPTILNRYFATISSAHPPCDLSSLNNVLLLPLPTTHPSFIFSPTCCQEVLNSLNRISSKSRGLSPDHLCLAHLKPLLPIISPHLTRIFNLSFSTCIFPSIWKSSFIIPLNKITNPLSPSDTRPIANPPHLSKVIDSLATQQITRFLENNQLLHPKQCGFRRFHSTQTALLHLLDDIRSGIDRGYVTILVLFDFTKAFDSLSHSVILTCLRDIGFEDSAIKWMHSFLSGRSQSIIGLDGQISQLEYTTSGVPQGTSLGPILFIIVINTLFSRLQYCRDTAIIFADDTQFYLSTPISRLSEAVGRINNDIAGLVRWSQDFGLTLNTRKTQAIIIGSPQNLATIKSLTPPPIKVGPDTIPYSNEVKDLGVIITSDLSWNRHVNSISSKVHNVLYRLKYRGSFLSPSIKLSLVNSLVIPHLDYATLVIADLSGYLNVKMQRLQNNALRYIYRLRRDDRLAPFRRNANWLSVSSRRLYFLGSLAHQIINTNQPSYLSSRFIRIDSSLRRSSRIQSSHFMLPTPRTNIFARSFWITAIHYWNSLPYHLQNLSSPALFRSHHFAYLLQADHSV